MSSSAAKPNSTDQDTLHPYYCSLCGAPVLLLSTLLPRVPLRRTDLAHIIQPSIFHKKVNLTKLPKFTVLQRGEQGIEKQYRWKCKDCEAVIGYQS